MNLNHSFELAHDHYQKLAWWLDSSFGGYMIEGHLQTKFKDAIQKDMETKYFELYPRRKNYKWNVMIVDHKDDVASIHEKYKAKAQRYLLQKLKQKDLLFNWLQENAPNVVLSSKWQVTYKSEFYTYSTQTAKEHYCLADVKRKAEKLDKHDIPYEIKLWAQDDDYNLIMLSENKGKIFIFDEASNAIEVNSDRTYIGSSYRAGHNKPHNSYAKGYCLYAPISPAQLFAIELLNNETVLEWAVSCWRNGSNPKVVNPFLSNEVFDKSLDIHMGKVVG